MAGAYFNVPLYSMPHFSFVSTLLRPGCKKNNLGMDEKRLTGGRFVVVIYCILQVVCVK